MTGACHAPVNGRQGKALADADLTAVPVPIGKIRRFGDGWQRGFSKSSLPVGGGIEANPVAERLTVTPYLRMWVLPTSRKRRQRLPQKPHTPSESAMLF